MDTHTVDGQHICTMYSYRSMQGKQQLRMNPELKTLRSYHPIPIFGLSENMVQLYLNFPSSFIMIFPSADVLEPR